MKETVLCYVIDQKKDQVLLMEKKTGQGAGKWNAPGGKVENKEDLEAAAARECVEETGIQPLELEKVGVCEFYFSEGNNWDNRCHIFRSYRWTGEQVETKEARPEWTAISNIPWNRLWESDRVWLHLVFEGQAFHRKYWFDSKDRVKKEEILL
jgi:8-oxo-dGTP diphosphatase